MAPGDWCIDDAETVDEVPVWINVFGPCARIGRALGLGIDLPELTDQAETQALWQLPDDIWKDRFEGWVSDTMRSGDEDWIRLAEYHFGIAFFDREEGVKFYTTVANLAECLGFIVSLANKGVELCDPEFMGKYGGENGSCVWVSQAIFGGGVPDAEPIFEKIGLVTSRPKGRPPWVLPPNWQAP